MTHPFFAAAGAEKPRPRVGTIDIHDRTTCRWCLQKFDPERAKPRPTIERGALRTRLMMADNGSELVICDDCWDGATGTPQLIQGRVVPGDPHAVLPLLQLSGA